MMVEKERDFFAAYLELCKAHGLRLCSQESMWIDRMPSVEPYWCGETIGRNGPMLSIEARWDDPA